MPSEFECRQRWDFRRQSFWYFSSIADVWHLFIGAGRVCSLIIHLGKEGWASHRSILPSSFCIYISCEMMKLLMLKILLQAVLLESIQAFQSPTLFQMQMHRRKTSQTTSLFLSSSDIQAKLKAQMAKLQERDRASAAISPDVSILLLCILHLQWLTSFQCLTLLPILCENRI